MKTTDGRNFMHKQPSRIAIIAVCWLVGCSGVASSPSPIMSPAELIGSASTMDGQVVTVRGYVESGYERYRIWDTKEAATSVQPDVDCVNISFRGDLNLLAFDGRYAEVSGRFVEKVPNNVVVSSPCANRGLIVMEPDSIIRLVADGKP